MIFDYFFEILILGWFGYIFLLFYNNFYRINVKADDGNLMEKYILVETFKNRKKI